MAGQNKFTKSVLERLEQEQKKQKKEAAKAPAPEKPVSEISLEPQEVPKQVLRPTKEVAPERPPTERTPAKKVEKPAQVKAEVEKSEVQPPEKAEAPDLSAFLPKSPERIAKNKTFYLDEEVIEALHKAAKAQKMTASRLVNEILRGVLGV